MSSKNTTINIIVNIENNGNGDLYMNRRNAPRKTTKKVESSSSNSSSSSRSGYYISSLPSRHK